MSRDTSEQPTPMEVLSYVHVMLSELARLASPVRDDGLDRALEAARREAEAALGRCAQSMLKAARGDAA